MPSKGQTERQRRGRRPFDHYDGFMLRCTRCRKAQDLVMPVDADHNPDWSLQPLIRCPGCDFMGAPPNYRIYLLVHGTARGM